MLHVTKETLHKNVCEDYRVLLRADAELLLPSAYEKIADFYRRVGDACMEWVIGGEGERLRARYLSLEDHMERARVRTVCYHLRVIPVWETEDHAAFVCRSTLSASGETPSEYVMSQLWNLSEQTVLPSRQVLRLCPPAERQRPPFRPDGVYPQGDFLVFYKNERETQTAIEFRLRCREEREEVVSKS